MTGPDWTLARSGNGDCAVCVFNPACRLGGDQWQSWKSGNWVAVSVNGLSDSSGAKG